MKKTNNKKTEKQKIFDKRKKKLEYYKKKYKNAGIIIELMEEKEYKDDFRNYIVIGKDTMVDYKGEYKIIGKQLENEDDMYIIHKKHLNRFVDEQDASKFWNKKMRRRV